MTRGDIIALAVVYAYVITTALLCYIFRYRGEQRD